MTNKRYVAPVGIHGFRRRVMRWMVHRWLPQTAAVEPSPLPLRGIDRILICRTSHSLGNTLLLTPLIDELEQLYPGAEIDIVTQSPVACELYGKYFSVRDITVLPSRFPPHLFAVWKAIRKMRAISYDLAIDPDRRSKTGRALLSLARARYKLGFASAEKPGELTHAIPLPCDVRHVARLPVYLLRRVLGADRRADYPRPDIRLTPVERAEGALALDRLTSVQAGHRQRPVVGVFANATGAKRLGREWWDPFLDQLESLLPDHTFIELTPIHGTSLLDLRYPTHYCSDLRKLTAVLSQLSMFVSVDCGLMHLAWASGTRTAGLFTGTDVTEWGPYGDRTHVIESPQASPQDTATLVAQAFHRVMAPPIRITAPVL